MTSRLCCVWLVVLAWGCEQEGPEGGGVCCPVDPMPTCDCTMLGGWAPDRDGCGGCAYDHPPSGLVRDVDSRGCAYLRTTPTEEICGWRPGDGDAGGDAGRRDGGPLPPRVTPSPDGAGYCCAPGYPSCDCTPTGGFVERPEDCETMHLGVCDGHPADWHLRTDAHGCAYYEVGFTTCCNCPDAGPPDAGWLDAGP